MKKILFLTIIILGGCVNNDISQETPDKTKSVTVWSSDLKLSYDRLRDEGEEIEEEVAPEPQEIKYVKPLPEKEEVREVADIPEVGDEDLTRLLESDLAEKITRDEALTKKIEKLREVDTEEEKKFPLKTALLVALGALAAFGGYFRRIKRRDEDEEE